MLISETEREWALELKREVVRSEDLWILNDMWYAQYAIVSQGDIDDALKRVRHMQKFRIQYKIQNTMECAMEIIEAMLKQQPGFLLSIDVARMESVNVLDFGAFNPKKALHIERAPDGNGMIDNWRTVVAGIYFMKYIAQPSLCVVRTGLLQLMDFGDFGWGKSSLMTMMS